MLYCTHSKENDNDERPTGAEREITMMNYCKMTTEALFSEIANLSSKVCSDAQEERRKKHAEALLSSELSRRMKRAMFAASDDPQKAFDMLLNGWATA